MKMVINVSNDLSPTQDNILVYNAKTTEWECTTKSSFLNCVFKDLNNKYDELCKRLETDEKMITTNGDNIKKIAEITKENL